MDVNGPVGEQRGMRLQTKLKLVLALVLLLAAAAYGGVVYYFYTAQQKLVFPQTVNKVAAPDRARNPTMDMLTLLTPDGTVLHGLLLPPPQKQPLPTLVLAFGGNAHDVTGMVHFLKNDVFDQGNVVVAGYSYRGYPNALGQSSGGSPTEANVEADAVAEYDDMVRRFGPARVQVVGYSLGTAVATYLATQRPVSDLVLVAPFSSMTAMAKAKYGFLPVDLLLKYTFDTAGRLRALAARPAAKRPALTVAYGPADGFIPTSQPLALAALYPSTTLLVLDGSTHGKMLDNPALPDDLRKVLK